MENSLSPAFVKINYESPYAPHTMTLPSVPLIAAIGDAPPFFDLRGAEIDVNVDTAIRDFCAILKLFYKPDVTLVDYTVFSQPGVGDTPVPVWSDSLGIAGTSASTLAEKAIQMTWSFRATDFTLFKLVMLDAPPDLGFNRVTALPGSSKWVDMRDYVVADATWIASRGGGRPNTFLQVATTLNEKLRRSYRMN